MKPILSIIAAAGLFSMAACSNSSGKQAEAGSQRTIDSLNTELTRKKVVDSMNEAARMQSYPMPVVAPVTPGVAPAAPVAQPVAHAHSATHVHHTAASSSQSAGSGTVAQAQPVYEQPAPVEAPKKKGWSAKAKGAVIGAGAGAVTGAIIDHNNRGAGAVIGGLLGAGAGTGAGAIIDKKKGR